MDPSVALNHTVSYLPDVGDTIALLVTWGGLVPLAMAAVMALASARELWPLVRLRDAVRNRLVPGRCLVDGVVEEGPDKSPVTVEIEQEYRRGFRSGGRWIERARRVRIVPFDLRLDDGRRVRVMPADDRVELLCKLRKPPGGGLGTRTLTAQVSICERVLVEGELVTSPATGDGPYRSEGEATSEPELRPSAGRPLWIAREREARSIMIRASLFYATLMLALLTMCVVTQCSSGLREQREFAAHGQVVDAKLLTVHVPPPKRGSAFIRAVLPNGQVVASQVNRAVAETLQRGATVPWTYLPADPSVNSPGAFQRGEPRAVLYVIATWMAWLLAMIIYWRSYRPWYRRIEVNQFA